MTKRKKWWTLKWNNGEIDIDADNQLHLYKTKKDAEVAAQFFDGQIPEPIKIKIEFEK